VRFEWDVHNADHVFRHRVSLGEVEEALNDPRRLGVAVRRVDAERRWAALGTTGSGRTLFVVFTRRGSRVRVVTARDATAHEKQRYRRWR
jgi:uncharacterized protein